MRTDEAPKPVFVTGEEGTKAYLAYLAEHATAVQSSLWIKNGDGWPLDDVPVLIARVDQWRPDIGRRRDGAWWLIERDVVTPDVTHWQPLPVMPNGDWPR